MNGLCDSLGAPPPTFPPRSQHLARLRRAPALLAPQATARWLESLQ